MVSEGWGRAGNIDAGPLLSGAQHLVSSAGTWCSTVLKQVPACSGSFYL